MEISRGSTRSRNLLRGIILVLVIAVLAGAAVLFAPGLRADTLPSRSAYTTGAVPYVNSASPLFRPAAAPALSISNSPTGYRDAGASAIRVASNTSTLGYLDAGASAVRVVNRTVGWADSGASLPVLGQTNGGWRDVGAGSR